VNNPERAKSYQKDVWLYRHTPVGYLKHKYSAMKKRVTGYYGAKNKYWFGKELCSLDDFLAWSLKDPRFKKLFRAYLKNGESRMNPSINRIDVSIGYTIANMCWITWSENSREAQLRRWSD